MSLVLGQDRVKERWGLELPGHFSMAYLLLSLLSQEGRETERPPEMPLPEGHLRDHPEDPAAMPGLPLAQVPGERHEEGE